MRKFLSLVLMSTMLALNAGATTTFTTNYSLAKPSDGSTTWGADIRNDLDSIDSQMFINAGSISTHISDTTGAHAASAISTTAGTTCANTDAQAFLNCLDAIATSSGTVTSVSVVSANGFAGSVATSTTTPAITLSTSITGILKGDGTAISAAVAGDFPTLNQSTTGNADTATTSTNLSGGLGGSIPYQSAASTTAMLANGTVGQVLTSQGTTLAPIWTTPSGGAGTVTSVDMTVPTFLSVSGNPITTSGTLAVTLSGTALPLANGGTGQTSAQAAIDSLAGAVTSGSYLRGNGTNVVMSTIQAADVPTLNQNTTGTAATFTGNLTGDVTSTGMSTSIAAATVTGKVLTGYSIGTTVGTVSASDTILDAVQKLAGNQRIAEFDDGNSGASDTIDFSNGPAHKSTLTGNCTFTFSNPIAGQAYILKTVGDGTVRTITWPAAVKWVGGTAPTMTGTAGKFDLINFYYDGTNYLGSYTQNY